MPLSRAVERKLSSPSLLSLAACLAVIASYSPPHVEHRVEPTQLELRPCQIPGTNEEALCGTHKVWEDRDARRGRRIPLNTMVLPAVESTDAAPVLALAGGPGGAATDMAPIFRNSPLRRRHDIVLVDQRGTGGSNRLDCPGLRDLDERHVEVSEDYRRAVASCRRSLEQRADLSLYGTAIAMDDLEEVRLALGYGTVNLLGLSYGTRAAQVFMRRHPGAVRAAVLVSTSPVEQPVPLYMGREAQNALAKTAAACASDAACSARFSDLQSRLRDVARRLDEVPHVTPFRGRTLVLTGAGFAEGVLASMYFMPLARSVPLIIQSAWDGDYRPLVQILEMLDQRVGDQVAIGMQLSVICGEDVPRITEDEIDSSTSGTFLGDQLVRGYQRLCEEWPVADVSEGFGRPVVADIPTLLWTGEYDPVTGADSADIVGSNLPDSIHLVVPGGHGVSNRCVNAVTVEFLRSGATRGLDTSCTAAIRLPPFAF